MPLSKYIFIFCCFFFCFLSTSLLLYFRFFWLVVLFLQLWKRYVCVVDVIEKEGFYSHRRVDNVWDTITKRKREANECEKRKTVPLTGNQDQIGSTIVPTNLIFHTLEAVLRFMSCEWLIFYVIMISIFMAEGCWQQQHKHKVSRQIKNHRTHTPTFPPLYSSHSNSFLSALWKRESDWGCRKKKQN